jgi:hypothetical protein
MQILEPREKALLARLLVWGLHTQQRTLENYDEVGGSNSTIE